MDKFAGVAGQAVGMIGGGGGGPQYGQIVQKPAGLAETLDGQIKRLADISVRLGQVADNLYGPQPQSAGSTDPNARPVTSIASRTRDADEWISRIQANLARIENAF